MDALFQPPDLGLDDLAVIEEIGQIRARLASVLRAPKRWEGGLRRTSRARAIQGSNSIGGYTVSDQDAAAAVEDEPPLTAYERTWAGAWHPERDTRLWGSVQPPRSPHAGADAAAAFRRGRAAVDTS